MQTPDAPHVFLTERPEYGVDYGFGWIGFNHADSNMSAGIAHLQRWRRKREIVVSHVFVVSGENECVEAAFPKGVVKTPLDEAYFDRDDRYVVFRKPKGLDDAMAKSIVELAREQVGKDFNHDALVNHALNDNFLGWLVNYACGGSLRDCGDRFLTRDDRWICSELGAYCLDQQPSLSGKGVLKQSHGAITPQELFDDDELFEPVGVNRLGDDGAG